MKTKINPRRGIYIYIDVPSEVALPPRLWYEQASLSEAEYPLHRGDGIICPSNEGGALLSEATGIGLRF